MKTFNLKEAEEIITNGEIHYIFENGLYNSKGEYLHGLEGTDGDITDEEWAEITDGNYD